MRLGMRLVFGILLAAACSGPLLAQESGPTGNGNAPYFRGKQIRILLSAGVAGGYAEYGRLLTQHLGNHIAGKPDFIVQSMPGAGGLLATNYLYSQAPADGTTIGLIHASVPLMPLPLVAEEMMVNVDDVWARTPVASLTMTVSV